jgi:hypothetical protein
LIAVTASVAGKVLDMLNMVTSNAKIFHVQRIQHFASDSSGHSDQAI